MKSRRAKPPPGTVYRVGELSRLSGVSVQTIRFYVIQGLLPAPVKTSRNMGWYSDRHARLLELIQKLQRERFLPLKTIRALVLANEGLEFTGDDEERLEHLRMRLQSGPTVPAAVAATPVSMDLGRLTEKERTALRGLDRDPEHKGREPDPALVQQWVAIRDAVGVPPEFLTHISELADKAVAHELDVLGERFRSMTPEEAEKILDVVIPGLNTLFGLMHQRKIGQYFGSPPKVPMADVVGLLDAGAVGPGAAGQRTHHEEKTG